MQSPRRMLCCLALLLSAVLPAAGARAQGEDATESALIAAVTAADDPLERAAAAAALGRLDPAMPRAAQRAAVLVEALVLDLDYPVRGRAAEALGRIGPVTEEVVPALLEALSWDTHLMVRWHVAAALERIAAQHPIVAESVLPALLAALQGDSQPGVRARVAEALGKLDPGDEAVVPALVLAFHADRHPGVRWQAAASLDKLAALYAERGTSAVVPDLKEALAALDRHPHPDVKNHAEGLRQSIQHIEGQRSSQAPE